MKKFKITKEQINVLAQQTSWCEDYLRNIFPEAFQSELEVGKWYKTQYSLVFINKEVKHNSAIGYGFDGENNWTDNWHYYNYNKLIPATDKEVETALIEEAKRRGFKEGITFKNFNGANQTFLSFCGLSESFNSLLSRTPKEEWGNKNCNSNPYIFKDGKWAEIINEPLTLEQRVEQLEKQLL